MKWFSNFSTRTKLLVGFGAIWLLLVVIVAVAYWSITGLIANERELYNFSLQRALRLQELTSAGHLVRVQFLELSMSNDPARRKILRAATQQQMQRNDQIAKELQSLDRNHLYEEEIRRLNEKISEYRDTRQKVYDLFDQGKEDQARALTMGAAQKNYEDVISLLAEMRKKERARSAAVMQNDVDEANWVLTIFVILGVIAFALVLMLTLLLNYTIAKPLGTMAAVAATVAKGDLTPNLEGSNRRDEVGVLGQSFREMIGSLRRSTSEIATAINQLGSAASEITAATTQVASGTTETAAAISETTSTVEEVRQAAQLSSQKAEDVSANAQGVAHVSQDGKQAVDQAAEGMQRIRKEMESIANTIVFLSEQGQSIGNIIATVTDLADQSNLLAVNAAIEAAKAGDQGKGFAVVAQEIKDLAEQSKQATTQIRNILNDVQKATSAAVMATEQGSKAVEEGVKQSSRAGEVIQALTSSTVEAAKAATQIAVSSRQQLVGMDQIYEAMENINQASTESASSMKQVETAAHDINRLGQDLKQLAERYRV